MADAGIGEAMLISAAIGGGSSAIQGQDPIKGALLGGALGGLGAWGAGALGSSFGTSGQALAAGEGAGAAFGQQAAGLGTAGLDVSGMIPIETGFYDPATMSNIAAPAVSTPQGLAAQQINAMSSLSPELKSQFIGNANMLDPTQAVKEAATYNRVFQGPASGIAGLGEKTANWIAEHPKTVGSAVAGLAATSAMSQPKIPGMEPYSGPLSFFKYDPRKYSPDVVTPPNPPYRPRYAAQGGIMSLAAGGMNAPTGPVERLSQQVIGAGGMYPQSQIDKTYFATPTQMPASAEVVGADYDTKTNPYTGVMMAAGGKAASKTPTNNELEDQIEAMLQKRQAELQNKKDFLSQHNTALRSQGIASIDLAGGGLGGYSDGGRMLKGPGDGMSDSIPGVIGGKRPARLADGEFVVPADVVSHLGNGSTDAGAKKLYGMMDRVRQARTGSKKQGRQINPNKLMPA